MDDVARTRLDQLEKSVDRLDRRQDSQAAALERLRADLRQDLRDTEARIEKHIRDSHAAVVREIGTVEDHLTAQDQLLQGQFQRETGLLKEHLVGPVARKWWLGIAGVLLAYLLAHFGAHIF